MEKWKKRSVELLTSIIFGRGEGSTSVVPYYPQKTAVSVSEYGYFERSTPEEHGISSKRIYNLLAALESEERSNVHSIMILKDGEVISECAAPGYSVSSWHLSHSMSKTVTGLAVGMLVDDGVLEVGMRLVDLLPGYEYKDKRFADITLHHLLSMTAGVSFSEAGSVTDDAWCESFFSSSMKFAPGTKFLYNSMNSYILAKIVTKVTGKSFCDFLDERLFSPLGITSYLWEKGPEGIEKGGWGLYLSPESWAKIGLTVLSGGSFEGKRIISEEWIERSTAAHAVSPRGEGDFNYGYHVWVGRNNDEVLFNGMLGQNVWICPKNRIVAVVFSGNNEIFQDSPTLGIIRRYLGSGLGDTLHKRDVRALRERERRFFATRSYVRPLERKRGFLYRLGAKPDMPFDERLSDITSRFVFARNGETILPLFVRAMQNNLDTGIEEISFERYSDLLFMNVKEGGESYRIELGLYGYEETVINMRGELYAVKAMAEARTGPDGRLEYFIELVFPELPNKRQIKVVRLAKDRALFTLSEIPDNKIVDALIARAMEQNGALGFVVGLLERRFGRGFINEKVRRTFSPTLVGADSAVFWYNGIVEEENLLAAEQSRAIRLLRAVVDRFFTEGDVSDADEPEGEVSAEKKRPSIIGELIRIYRSTAASRNKEEKEPTPPRTGRAVPLGPKSGAELPPAPEAVAEANPISEAAHEAENEEFSEENNAVSTEELLNGIEEALRHSEEREDKISPRS